MYILIFALGGVIGSFLNVCIYRIPKEESIVFPPSHCIDCSHPLAWYDLVPIVSYLSLRGKCRYCGGVISPQYPIIEALNAIIYLFLYLHFGLSAEFVFYGIMASILIVVCLIDYYHQIIPDGIILLMFVLTVIYKASEYLIYGTPLFLRDPICGFLAGGLLFLAIAVISGGAMGGGDIKLIAVLGLILGLKKTLLNILLSFFIGAVVSIYLLASGRKGRKDAIPFGPFINIAFIITLFYGDMIINRYMQGMIP